MNLKKVEKKEFVRVMVGRAVTGQSGIKAPTKSIGIENATVEEVFDKIRKMVEDDGKTKK